MTVWVRTVAASAGLVLIYTHAFQAGETVRIGEVAGTVTEKNILVTPLSTSRNEEITIPNGIVLVQAVRNNSTFAKSEVWCCRRR